MSINNDIIFLENIKQGFKRTITCDQYISEITTQTKNFKLDYLNDPAFRIINISFLLPFKNDSDDPTRKSSVQYYMPLVEIKDFNGLIDNNLFFDQPLKETQETYEKLIEMLKNDDLSLKNIKNYFRLINCYRIM